MSNPSYYGIPKNVNPLLFYSANRIPFENSGYINNTDEYSHLKHFNSLVSDVAKHRDKHNLTKISHDDIRKTLLAGRSGGFWDDLYGGIKHVVSSIGNSALQGVDTIISNPTSAISAIAPLVPLMA